ncbi:MAG: tetratricopeptide repeat protein [Bacteroidia bacterium]
MKKCLFILLILFTSSFKAQKDSIDKILKKYNNDSLKLDRAVFFIDTKVKTFNDKIILLDYLKEQTLNPENKKQNAFFLFQYGQLYYDQSKYSEAINYLYKALPIAEETNYIWLEGKIYNYLGIIFSDQGDSKKAVTCFIKTYNIAIKTNDIGQQFVSTNNVAVDLTNIGEHEKALYYLTKAEDLVKTNKKFKKKDYLISIHGNKLNAYGYLNNFNEAKKQLDSVVKYYNLYKHQSSNTNISFNTFNSDYLIFTKDYKPAIKYLEDNLNLIADHEFHEKIKVYKNLHICYNKLNMYKQAYDAITNYYRFYDSIASSEKLRLSNEHEESYKNLKIENDLKIANLTNSNNELKLKRNQIIFLLGGCLIVILIIAFYIVTKLLNKNKQKNILLEKQKTLIEDKQTEILSSIRYAKRIQDSLLPSKKYISKNINKQNGAK